MTITLRTQTETGTTTKGSTLTHAELDNNFIDLLQNKIKPIDVRGDTGTQLVGQSLTNEILQVVGGTGISTSVTADSAGQARITITNSQTAFVPASPGEIGASTPADASFLNLNVKSESSTVKELRLHDQDNSNYVGFKSPTTVTTNKVYVLPATDGTATHFLQTDGAGNLSWAAGSSFAPASPGEIGASTPADASFLTLNVKSAGSVVKELRLHDEDNSNYVGFKSPTTVSTNKVYVLPATDGSPTHVLQTDGAGNLSWAAGSTFAPASPGEIGATTPDIGNFTDLKVKSASSTVKELQLHDQDNSNYVGFKAPTSVSTNKVWVLPATDGTNGQMLTTDGSATLSWTTASTELSTDTTPQLGGDLDVNTRKIVSTASGNIELQPDGGGDVYLTADTIRVGDNNANVTITTNGTGDLILNTNAGSSSGSITIEDGSNGDITLAPNGTGRVEILGTANQQASIRLFEELSSAGNTQSTLLQASKFISADITLTLPNTTSTLGYQNLPAVGTKTGSYTLATGDVGKYVQVGSGGSITIPNSTFAEGDVIVIANNHTAAITITCTITTAYIGGTDTDKATVSLATRGVCNILFLSGTACIITGNVS